MVSEAKDLSQSELKYFNQFLLKLIKCSSTRSVSVIYRGDSLISLHEKLGVHYNENCPDYEQLLNRLFMVGEKSKTFYDEHILNVKRGQTFDINDTSEIIFKFIFDSINSSIKSKNQNTRSFFDKNTLLKDYFSNKVENKKDFITKTSQLRDKKKLLARNYYFALLHQLGSIRYKNKSHYTSTSEDYSVARQFSSNQNGERQVIIHAWTSNNRLRHRVKNLSLPVYYKAPYQEQKEISILAGILPHYIIGLEVIDDDLFFINPNLLMNIVSNDTYIGGLHINQADFDRVHNMTNYQGSFFTDGEGLIERKRKSRN